MGQGASAPNAHWNHDLPQTPGGPTTITSTRPPPLRPVDLNNPQTRRGITVTHDMLRPPTPRQRRPPPDTIEPVTETTLERESSAMSGVLHDPCREVSESHGFGDVTMGSPAAMEVSEFPDNDESTSRNRRLRRHISHLSQRIRLGRSSTNLGLPSESGATGVASGSTESRSRSPSRQRPGGLRMFLRPRSMRFSRPPSPPPSFEAASTMRLRRLSTGRSLGPISAPLPPIESPEEPRFRASVTSLWSNGLSSPQRRTRLGFRNSLASFPGMHPTATRRYSNIENRRATVVDDITMAHGNQSATDLSPSPTRERQNPVDEEFNLARVRPGEDQAAMLSRLLSVAAAATAHSLVGNSQQALNEARDVGSSPNDDSIDGSFDSFLRALQSGRLAQALRNGGNELGGGVSEDGQGNGDNLAPLNFFRMFRFGSNANTDNLDDDGNPLPRMVPVIIVGIRSVTPRDPNNGGPFMDALAALPIALPINQHQRANRRASNGDLFRDERELARASRRGDRPVSEVFAASRTAASNFAARASSPLRSSPLAHSTEGSPSGPLPPPTTPAESAEASRRHSRHESSEDAASQPTSPTSRPTRLRSSRNASVDEDNTDATPRAYGSSRRDRIRRQGNAAPQEGTRSWIIYVLGGTYPENHPILTTPSLFTDSPTHEDMLLLSSLLGPVKPPVATREDVDSAGGELVIVVQPKGTPRPVVEVTQDGVWTVTQGDRCLVCLSDFENGEKCRKLKACGHLFHMECIDEWLTTGRNSCPLCRGQGVTETPSAEQAQAS